MSSYDKVVKLACKPKAAPPKAKYLDPIIAATWSDDGAVHDVCKALQPRIREPNAIVVFKALIVLHTMIRNGATDNVLGYLSSGEVLRLRNVAAANWEGYAAPQNLQNYALYLDSRIHAYKDLKHDAVRVQAESNRDMRNSASVEEEGYRGRSDRTTKPNASLPTRSKTIMGRKLRSMTVEKGLLRETKAVHNMIDALVECRFYLDDLEDELTITALRMLVKDLLILFQAGNEGVINVLEHYFEMSHVDAEEALVIYRHFCKQTEYVVEYLGVAKKLQNLLNVPVPNLKHAPVSLAGALQEYLDDSNFEQNRIEYKTNKDAAERGAKTNGKRSTPSKATETKSSSATSPKVSFTTPTKDTSANPSVASSSKPTNGNDVKDFFASIEDGQPTMFNPQTNSPNTAYFHQQGAANPFQQMLTGQPFMQQQPQIAVQQTGFLMPQQTAMPQQQQPNPFGNFLAPQPTGHRPFSSFIQPQATAVPQQMQMSHSLQPPQQFLQPQMTGSNPFRQSMLMPQSTGMQLFATANQGQQMTGAAVFAPPNQGGYNMGGNMGGQPSGPSSMPQTPASASPFAAPRPSFGAMTNGVSNTPARPASTPLTSTMNSSSPNPQPVKTHVTGTRNPFGPSSNAAPPVPKAPTLLELSTGMFNQYQNQPNQTQMNQFGMQQQQQQQSTGLNGFSFANSALNPGPSDISSVASSFAFSNKSASSTPLTSQNTSATNTTTTGSTFSDSMFSSSLSSNPTGTTNSSSMSPSMQNSPMPPVKSHMTGFAGLKAFKPSSSFGASLLETIPGSAPATPAVTGLPSTNGTTGTTGTTPSFLSSPPAGSTQNNNLSFLRNQPTGASGGFGSTPTGGPSGVSNFGQSLGVGLRPQMTGGGSANPFRASMAGGLPMPNFGGGFQSSMPTGMGMGMGGSSQPFNAGGSAFGTSPFGMQNQQQQQQQQPNGSASLI